MADISDVCDVLVGVATALVYPGGTGLPSITGKGIRLYQGWPDPNTLDADLAQGVAHISVYPSQTERNTTRYPKDWVTLSVNAPTLTLTVNGQTITVAGTVPAASNPTNLSVTANGQSFVYPAQPADTLTSMATALAATIGASIGGTTSSGSVITLPATARITAARVGVGATVIRETRRQQRVVQIIVWANAPDVRTQISKALDVALSDMQFITLPDTFAARLIYQGSPITDQAQKQLLYRRDFNFLVEYPTTETVGATQVTQQQISVTQINAPTTTYNL